MCAAAAVLLFILVNIPIGRVTNYVRCFVSYALPESVSWDEMPPGLNQIVKNPDFEDTPKAPAKDSAAPADDAANEFVPHWRMGGGSAFSFLCRAGHALDPKVHRSGNVSARLSLTGLPQFDAASAIYQELRDPPGGEVAYLSVPMKSEDAVLAAASVYFASGEGAKTRQLASEKPFMVTLKGTTEWTEYRIKGSIPEGATRAIVEVVIRGSGVLWVDDVKLFVPAKEAAAAPSDKPAAAESGPALPATAGAAAELAVRKLVARTPTDFFKGRPVIFVAQVRDRTAERINTTAVRRELVKALTSPGRGRAVDTARERSAGLDTIDVLAGIFTAPRDAQSRLTQAGVRYAFFSDISPGKSPLRPVFQLWAMDVAAGSMPFMVRAEIHRKE